MQPLQGGRKVKLPRGLQEIRDRHWERLTPAQAAAVEENWRRISRRGAAIYVLLWSCILFVWMAICSLVFSYLFHALQVVRQPFFLLGAAPTMLLLSFAAPAAVYMIARSNMRRLEIYQTPHDSRHRRHPN
jgi:hypothetical protein